QLNFDLLGDYLVTLEDLRSAKITMGRKIRARINATSSAARLCRRYGSQTSVDDTAVVLFTSGSEAAPKGVPLSHRNVLANIAACVEAAKLDNSDVLYGFLPPFHS
ncbi:MAG: AMP-binding protein, partial [Lentisphaeria bacterium]|nr:AMP-binding protein [Lentisphaeria bacterium]